MPTFLLELMPPTPPRQSETDHGPTALEIDAALHEVLDPVRTTAVSIYWTPDEHPERIFLIFDTSHVIAAGIRMQLESPEWGFTIRQSHRLFRSIELDAEHGLEVDYDQHPHAHTHVHT